MAHTSGNAKKEVSVSILLEFYIHQALLAPVVVCSKENAKVVSATTVKSFFNTIQYNTLFICSFLALSVKFLNQFFHHCGEFCSVPNTASIWLFPSKQYFSGSFLFYW